MGADVVEARRRRGARRGDDDDEESLDAHRCARRRPLTRRDGPVASLSLEREATQKSA